MNYLFGKEQVSSGISGHICSSCEHFLTHSVNKPLCCCLSWSHLVHTVLMFNCHRVNFHQANSRKVSWAELNTISYYDQLSLTARRGKALFGPTHAWVIMLAYWIRYNMRRLYCAKFFSLGLITNGDRQNSNKTSLLPQRCFRWPSVILADWQAYEGQQGPSGIKVFQSCEYCLNASDIRAEGGGSWEVAEVGPGWVIGSSEKG